MEGVEVGIIHSGLDVASPVELGLVSPQAPLLEDLPGGPASNVPVEDAYSRAKVAGGRQCVIWTSGGVG